MKENKTASKFPRVSVILVNYNGIKWLQLFMPYLIRTKYPDFEIILVDNGSKDESISYIKKNFELVKVIPLRENKGFAEATNMGSKFASGDILAFLNNDIEVSEDWLMQAVAKLLSHQNAAAVQCKMMLYNDRARINAIGISVDKYAILLTIGFNEIDKGQYDYLQEIGAASAGAMIIWKHIFYEVACFDPFFFMYYEDIDLSWRLRLKGYSILPAISSIVYHMGSATANKNPSTFTYYHWSKNQLYCWLKNSDKSTILIYWPVIASLILGESIFILFIGNPEGGLAYLRGALSCLSNIKVVIKRRKDLQKIRKQKKAEPNTTLFVSGIIKGSTNFSFLMRRGRRLFR